MDPILVLTIKGAGFQNILSEESNKAISLPNRLQINDGNEITISERRKK